LLVCDVSCIPPVAAEYQRYCPAEPPEADKVMAVPLQPLLPETPGTVGGVLMTASTCVRLLSQLVAISKMDT
jgi:hypothetical protein